MQSLELNFLFCDTGWEHEITYKYLDYLEERFGINIIRTRSYKFDSLVDLAKKKGRFPSTKSRFCTEELKVKPMIDFILDQVNDNILVLQGIRAEESHKRATMPKNCEFFKFYFEPYTYDKNGRGKYYTYRKADVISFCKEYVHDVDRPIIDWSESDVFAFLEANFTERNKLYDMGFHRVGCFPCIMCGKEEFKLIVKNFPAWIQGLAKQEEQIGASFFPPKYIPKTYCSIQKEIFDKRSGKSRLVFIPTVTDVAKYVFTRAYSRNKKMRDKTLSLFGCSNNLNPCEV
ncbi:phosphoadenosine phosphosulfate reductase family protein [Pseudarcicella hirudinis]|uniref:phosphoadenosine phosphosulfate reductase family protein n=1 Tax=Pseudarcicella hirudinis TaxID=1079859 RepID=UPI0035EB0DCC